ncbi:hypothetical protein [Candidatus Accumulibacter sp. ACC012]|uniref:hypothetical protein n=1 Tax=Candidatus Accumulibacter sp. ACC012 TaxID=2823332 RepID=UPI0025C2D69B|nr:hypothetical protein [Candidatus Accumulibacter sp. ACC012]
MNEPFGIGPLPLIGALRCWISIRQSTKGHPNICYMFISVRSYAKRNRSPGPSSVSLGIKNIAVLYQTMVLAIRLEAWCSARRRHQLTPSVGCDRRAQLVRVAQAVQQSAAVKPPR